jgi:hypothetical protein
MPMGLKNAPAIHQRRVTAALRQWIGRICHIYLDDIVIWSDSVEEHIRNVDTILTALRAAGLYCNPRKTHLFETEIDFLGHHISPKGIEADGKKVERIVNWPRPQSATQVRQFLGLVRYISTFLPGITEFTRVLNELTLKEYDCAFPEWSQKYENAFQKIKEAVISRECLTTIDHEMMPENKIFVTTDASDYQSGGVLSFGPTWETARPVVFDSMTFKGAELNYPVHEKEMLAVIRALKRWRSDLIGVPFTVYTDHKTLENFGSQKDLSRRQARWMEFLSQYDCKIVYVKGEDNSVADALSRTTFKAETAAKHPCSLKGAGDSVVASVLGPNMLESARKLAERQLDDEIVIGATMTISADKALLKTIQDGYKEDRWCCRMLDAPFLPDGVRTENGLLYTGDRLIVPRVPKVREALFHLAHDVLGHFGFEKSYGSLRSSFYWPNMRRDLESGYVAGCADCQRNKSSTKKAYGPLHPLPIPDGRGDSVAIDFVGPLPEDEGFDCILSMTDRLNSDVRLIPTKMDLTAEELARVFFDEWYCENGLPKEIVSDRDKLFMSRFWKALHKLTGVKLKMSSAYHPQSDGASERTNKTLNQCLRFHVERNQTGWRRALPRVRFDIMNTVNSSTGFSPFQLRMGRSPRIIPPLVRSGEEVEDIRAEEVIKRLEEDVKEAQDNMLRAKISQALAANISRSDKFPFQVGEKALLSTLNRRREYKSKGQKRVAKFMPRYDGPYPVTRVSEEHSTVTLDLPNKRTFPTFHTCHVVPFQKNDAELFPSRELSNPGPVMLNDNEEFFVDRIIDERKCGRGKRYLVRWLGYGPEDDRWLPGRELEDCEALDIWLARSKSVDST